MLVCQMMKKSYVTLNKTNPEIEIYHLNWRTKKLVPIEKKEIFKWKYL